MEPSGPFTVTRTGPRARRTTREPVFKAPSVWPELAGTAAWEGLGCEALGWEVLAWAPTGAACGAPVRIGGGAAIWAVLVAGVLAPAAGGGVADACWPGALAAGA